MSWSSLSSNATTNHLTPTTRVRLIALPPPRDNTVRPPKSGEEDKVITEDLGKQTIAGLACTGTRTTTVIPIALIGNTRPITITDDVWTSSGLQMVVREVTDNPLNGTRTSEFISASRTEPPATLFHLPDDLTLKSPFAGGVSSTTR